MSILSATLATLAPVRMPMTAHEYARVGLGSEYDRLCSAAERFGDTMASPPWANIARELGFTPALAVEEARAMLRIARLDLHLRHTLQHHGVTHGYYAVLADHAADDPAITRAMSLTGFVHASEVRRSPDASGCVLGMTRVNDISFAAVAVCAMSRETLEQFRVVLKIAKE